MKKAILILMLLPFFASGQAIWKVSADSSKFYNVGNTGNELIIENDTRTVTNGVLTNIGNGRTIFALPSAGTIYHDSTLTGTGQVSFPLGLKDTAKSYNNIYNYSGTIPTATKRKVTLAGNANITFQTGDDTSAAYNILGIYRPTIYADTFTSNGYFTDLGDIEYFTNSYRSNSDTYNGNIFGGWKRSAGVEDQEWSILAGVTNNLMSGAAIGENHTTQSWMQMNFHNATDGISIVPRGLHDGVTLFKWKGTNIFTVYDTTNTKAFIVTNASKIKTPTILTDNTATSLYAQDLSGNMVLKTVASISGDTATIYKSDGALTANRTVDGNNKSLTFGNVSAYTFGSTDLYFYRGGIGSAVKLAGEKGASGSHSISNYVTRDTSTGALIGAIGYTGVAGRYGGLYSTYSSSGAKLQAIESVPATSSFLQTSFNDTTHGVSIIPLDGLGATWTGANVFNVFNTSNTSTFRVNSLGRISNPNMPVESCDTLLGYNSSGQQAKILKSSVQTDTSKLSFNRNQFLAFRDTFNLGAATWGMVLKNNGNKIVWAADSTGAGSSLAIGSKITSATAGSVLYAGTGGYLEQSNTNFYYDSTNARLSVGGDLTPTYSINTATSGTYGIGDSLVLSMPNSTSIVLGNSRQTPVMGVYNAIAGVQAGMKLTTTSSENSFLGYKAGWQSTTTNKSVMVGTNAGYQLTASNNVTAVGFNALESSGSSCNSCTGIGTNVLLQATGTTNTAIGGLAGANITSGANNFCAGYSAYVPTATASDQMSIQNAIYGTGNSGATTTVSTGKIGFYVKAPASTVEINGSLGLTYIAKTANYTATVSDHTINCTANTFTVTLPTAVSITGRQYTVVNSGSGTITIGTTSSQTFTNINATPTTLTLGAVGAGAITSYTVMSNGANWIVTAKVKDE